MVIGCDVAKHTDFTVLVAMDAATGRCFGMDRFNHLDWPVQKDRILGFVRRVSWPGIRTSTVPGKPGERDLTTDCTDGHGWDVLTNEMKRYEYVISASGGISYGAPSGYPYLSKNRPFS